MLLLSVVLLLAARQVEERVVQWRAKWVVTLTIRLATRSVLVLLLVLLRVLNLLLLVVVVAKGLLATVSRWFRWLLDDNHASVVAALVEA